MAPAIDGLPAAEREVDVAEPVAALPLLAARRGPCRWCASRCAPSSGCPSPGASAASSVEARADYLAKMEGSRFSLYHDLLLLAKLLATLG